MSTSLELELRIIAFIESFTISRVLRELQSQTQEELEALMPSILDRAFKGEL